MPDRFTAPDSILDEPDPLERLVNDDDAGLEPVAEDPTPTTPSWTFRPLGERVVVTPIVEGDRTTGSGIIIPDTAKERPSMGTIHALGPGAIASGLRLGERVLHGKYSGHEVTIDEQLYIVLAVGEILSVMEPTSSHLDADAAITERMERRGQQLEAEAHQQYPDVEGPTDGD